MENRFQAGPYNQTRMSWVHRNQWAAYEGNKKTIPCLHNATKMAGTTGRKKATTRTTRTSQTRHRSLPEYHSQSRQAEGQEMMCRHLDKPRQWMPWNTPLRNTATPAEEEPSHISSSQIASKEAVCLEADCLR